MKPFKAHWGAILDAFRGSRLKQAIIGYVTLAGLFSEDGYVPIAEVKEALSISDETWEREMRRLYDDCDMWPDWDRTKVISGLTHEMARYAAPGVGGRPSASAWNTLRQRVFKDVFDGMRPHCVACKAEGVPLAIDHIIPVSRGGSNHRLNLMPLCVPCNSSKGTKTWEEWRTRK